MNISPGLIAKGTAGALAASAAVGTGVAAKNNDWFGLFNTNTESVDTGGVRNPTGGEKGLLAEGTSSLGGSSHDGTANQRAAGGGENSHTSNKSNSESQPSKKKTDLTKFDQGLINFLKANGDFTFDVKKGDVDLTADDLTFRDSGTNSLTAKISILVGKTEMKLIEPLPPSSDINGKRITLQKINGKGGEDGGAPWTWSCEVNFVASGTSLEGKSINDKDKIFSSAGEEGLFNLLKKDVFTQPGSEPKKGKSAKKRFIKACAKERGSDKNKTIEADGIPSTDNNELKSSITINLMVGADGRVGKTDVNKLYPSKEEDDKKFKELFGEITTTQHSD